MPRQPFSSQQTPDALRVAAGVFTRPVFAAVARQGNCNEPLSILEKAFGARACRSKSLTELYDEAWQVVSTGYRNEYVYKNELATRLVFGRHSPRTAGFQVEFPVAGSIADVVVANGTTTAYEIKTEYDTTKRLESQSASYLKAFDKVFVVTHPRHVQRFEQAVDERVGIIVLNEKGSMSVYRDAESNAENIDSRTVFRCLRRQEFLDAIELTTGEVVDLPNGLVHAYCEKVFSGFSAEDAHQIFVDALRGRTTDKNTVEFVTQLPISLRALGYATPLSGRQRVNVLKALAISM